MQNGRKFDFLPRGGRQGVGNSRQAVTDSPGEKPRQTLQNEKRTRGLLPAVREPGPGSDGTAAWRTEERGSVTVLIADDHPLVREGLVTLISRQSDMRVLGEASNGGEAVEKFLALRPDVAVLDLRMPVMDGVETAIAICQKAPTARLVMLTIYQSEEDIYRALRAGAQGYVLKDAPVQELVECVRAVGLGRTWICPEIGAKLAKRVAGQELTVREREVLNAVAAGKSNKEIGVAFNISEATVKVHVTHILEKLKASGRTEAINVAAKRGLIHLDSSAAA